MSKKRDTKLLLLTEDERHMLEYWTLGRSCPRRVADVGLVDQGCLTLTVICATLHKAPTLR